jgi:hypothetical protein
MVQVSNLSASVARLASKSRLYQALAFQEGQGGGTAMKFLQDTGSAWLPKMMVSRSKAEGAEVSLLEFGESAMTYALPMFLGPGLASLFFKLAGKNKVFDKKLLTETYETLMKAGDQKAAGQAMVTKAAVILSTIGGIGLWGESLVNYGKNLMTAKVFKKDKFSDVINLTQGQIQPQWANGQESPQVQKAKKRIKQATGAFAALLGGAFLLAKFGHRSEYLKKISEQTVRHLDFGFAKNSRGNVVYGLGNRKGLLGAMMLTCSLPYLDSARDGYERLETALRLPVVFGYILYGQEIIQKAITRAFPGLFEGALDSDGNVMSTRQIAKAALTRVSNGSHSISPEMEKLAAPQIQRSLQAKSLTVAVPLASGLLVSGLGLGLLNRFLTHYRFKRQNSSEPITTTSYVVQPALPMSMSSLNPGPSLPFNSAMAAMPSSTGTGANLFGGFNRGTLANVSNLDSMANPPISASSTPTT